MSRAATKIFLTPSLLPLPLPQWLRRRRPSISSARRAFAMAASGFGGGEAFPLSSAAGAGALKLHKGDITLWSVDGATDAIDHPTDAELINSPLEYYNYMELCFANKHATGIYSMGVSEPLGTPILVEDKDKTNVREGQGTNDEVLQDLPGSNFALPNASATQDPSPTSNKKRKRSSGLTEEDALQCSNMTDAMREIASAINNTCHAETHPDLYKAVMDLTMFDQNERLAVLDYLTEHKAKGLNFMKMDEEVRQASFKRILKANPDLL